MKKNRKSDRDKIDTTRLELQPSKAAEDSKISEVASKHRQNFFMGYFEIGRRAEQAFAELDDANKFSGVSHEALSQRFITETGLDEHTLRACVNVVNNFTEDEFRAAIAHREISWAHFPSLCLAATAQERNELVGLVCTNRWSPQQLQAEVLRRLRATHLLQPRQPRPPRNVKVGLKRLQGQAERFLRDSAKLFSKEYDLPSQFHSMYQGDVTEQLRAEITKNIALLKNVARQAAAQAADLKVGLGHFDSVLKLNNSNGVASVGYPSDDE